MSGSPIRGVAPQPIANSKQGAHNRPSTAGLAASVNENGCFESDLVTKCGYVERRTHKTRHWKTVYIVLRPTTLSVYKNEKETKLRHQIHLSDLTAVAFLKDPKHRRHNVFGLFSPSRNFHFQAHSQQDAQEWVDLVRKGARVDADDDMFLASPVARSLSPNGLPASANKAAHPDDSILGSSPEMTVPSAIIVPSSPAAWRDSAANTDWSGNELPSQSDMSENEGPRMLGTSFESLAIHTPLEARSLPRDSIAFATSAGRPPISRAHSQASVLDQRARTGNINAHVNANGSGPRLMTDADLDRVVWHGWVRMLRSKGGVRQWRKMWAVLRPRNLILYKDHFEYAGQWLVQLSAVVDVVDIDPLSKSKQNCLQIITEEKRYRFCARDEEALVQFIGAFKSLLAKRRGLDPPSVSAAAATAAAAQPPPPPACPDASSGPARRRRGMTE